LAQMCGKAVWLAQMYGKASFGWLKCTGKQFTAEMYGKAVWLTEMYGKAVHC